MRFPILRKADADTEAGKVPSAELIAAMTAYDDEMARADAFVDGECGTRWPNWPGSSGTGGL